MYINKCICCWIIYVIENYSINLFLYNSAPRLKYTDYGLTDEERIDLELDFNDLIESIKGIYISKTYLGLMSWLIDRAFCITPTMKSNKNITKNNTNKNKSLLIKVLYDINPNNLLKCFSKNIKN